MQNCRDQPFNIRRLHAYYAELLDSREDLGIAILPESAHSSLLFTHEGDHEGRKGKQQNGRI